VAYQEYACSTVLIVYGVLYNYCAGAMLVHSIAHDSPLANIWCGALANLATIMRMWVDGYGWLVQSGIVHFVDLQWLAKPTCKTPKS
jgi:hypothetical protein